MFLIIKHAFNGHKRCVNMHTKYGILMYFVNEFKIKKQLFLIPFD